ncbi:FeoA family protein [Clostridioides difficile]|uniref:FeoA family protein n=1 Tax=Clostridioides difficile TaxID=1496 RepID=UPI00097FE2F1|nr:FeoA family protein [Clostridioides difficile]SJQ74200.1 FeoA domain [Clostridioides difficile]
MMPLILSNTGEEVVIKKISGSDKTRTFLNSIGFVVGTNVKIVSKIDGNLIIDVKDNRVALDKKMASRIII